MLQKFNVSFPFSEPLSALSSRYLWSVSASKCFTRQPAVIHVSLAGRRHNWKCSASKHMPFFRAKALQRVPTARFNALHQTRNMSFHKQRRLLEGKFHENIYLDSMTNPGENLDSSQTFSRC